MGEKHVRTERAYHQHRRGRESWAWSGERGSTFRPSVIPTSWRESSPARAPRPTREQPETPLRRRLAHRQRRLALRRKVRRRGDWVASLGLRARRADGERSHVFEFALRQHESERPRRIIEESPRREPIVKPYPPGFSAEDFVRRPESEGFVPHPAAAAVMGMSEEETPSLARHGELEAFADGANVYVRPAIVSVLAVTT